MARVAAAVVLGLLVTLGAAGAPAATAAPAPVAAPAAGPPEEQAFVDRINQLRRSRGLPALHVDGQLVAGARSWAGSMAAAGRISHAGDLSVGVSAAWAKLGENVGTGGDVGSLFDAFVRSPSHYANLVDPAFTHIGVGVVWSGRAMYTTHRFMALAAPAPPPPPPPPPPVRLAAPVAGPPAAAPSIPPPVPEPSTPAPLDSAPAEAGRGAAVLGAAARALAG